MKQIDSAARTTRATARKIAAPLRMGRSFIVAASPVLSLAVFAGSPAAAACLQSGNMVTCSGATNTGFGTGVENNLTVTIQPDASITLSAAHSAAVGVGIGNTAINNGAIDVGNASFGMTGNSNNTFTNNGSMTLGAGSTAMFVVGDNNVLTNTGTIGSTAVSFGLDALGNGNTITNSGAITLTGAGSYGIIGNGTGNTILNSGVITASSSTGASGAGVFLRDSNNLTNTGTITAVGANGVGVSFWNDGNTMTNSGTIAATGNNGIAANLHGSNNTIVNNGTIRGGSNSYSLAYALGATGNTITNNGTLDGMMTVAGANSSLVNSGLITITDAGTALAGNNLYFAGIFTQNAQGALALRVDNTGNHDGLLVEQANLNGTLRAVLQPGLYGTTTTYSNVLAGSSSVNGQFANVTSSSAFFSATAIYNANTVDLTLTRQGFGAVAGETANQRAVGNALEAGYSTGLTGTAATFYTQLLQAGSVGVLDQLSGEGASGTQTTAFNAGALFGQTMDGQMDAWRAGNRGGVAGSGALGYAEARPVTSAFAALKAPPLVQPQWNAWGSGFGAGQSLSGDATVGSAGFRDRIAGGAAGVDRLFGPDLLVGIAVGGSSASFNVDDRATSGRVDGAHVGGYAMQRFGAAYLSAQLAYSHFDNSTTRTITGIGADEIAKGSFGSNQLGGRLEIGRTYDFGTVAVTPFAALQAARLWQAGYTETSVAGAGPGVLGLSYASRNVSSLPLFLGSKFDARFDLGNGMAWMPFASLAWVHEFSPTRDVTATLIAIPVPAFTVEGARAAADAGRVEFGSRLVLNRWSELSARFTGEFSGAGQSYAGTGSFRVSW